MNRTEFKKLIREEIKNVVNEQKLNEDLALAGDIALGIVGGLVGLYALVKGTGFVIGAMGSAAGALADRMETKAKAAVAKAKRDQRYEAIKPIVAKFANDTKLKDMYQALPDYSQSIAAKSQAQNKERTKQLQNIAKYIKSKLSPEEMAFFEDVSSMLRTGDIK